MLVVQDRSTMQEVVENHRFFNVIFDGFSILEYIAPFVPRTWTHDTFPPERPCVASTATMFLGQSNRITMFNTMLMIPLVHRTGTHTLCVAGKKGGNCFSLFDEEIVFLLGHSFCNFIATNDIARHVNKLQYVLRTLDGLHRTLACSPSKSSMVSIENFCDIVAKEFTNGPKATVCSVFVLDRVYVDEGRPSQFSV